MKILKIVLFIALLTSSAKLKAQNTTITRLRGELAVVNADNSRFSILDSLSIYYLFCSDKIDSSYFYCNQSIQKAFPLADKRPLILAYARMGAYFFYAAKYGAAIQILNKAIKLSQQVNYDGYLSYANLIAAQVYIFLDEFNKASPCLEKARASLKYSTDPFYNIPAQTFLAYAYYYLFSTKWTSGLYYLSKVNNCLHDKTDLATEDEYLEGMVTAYTGLRQYAVAIQYCIKGLAAVKKNNDHQTLDNAHYLMAFILQQTNKPGQAIAQAKLAMVAARAINDLYFDVVVSKLVSECYDSMGKTDSALYYLKENTDYYTELNKAKNISDVEAAAFSDEMQARETQAQALIEKEKDKDRLRLYGFVTGIGILLLVALIMWRNGAQRKKAYTLLQLQKLEIELQKSKVETALTELKQTQTQLIQSEKMASLGELTAGIAHEIQNPLNFVNNFSEVSTELIDELDEELDKGDIAEARTIASDIKQNLDKIHHHGKRADFIVKGMLQHSRTSTGEKQLTNINVLCDEFLKLAFHGMRAKDKLFNADLKTRFNPDLPRINVSQQDISRVILNLLNNAFYAVNEKQKQQPEGYEPTVTVSTQNSADKISISVRDNGNGIPQKILDKIYQPFFTTKPTGQGTGLGLSMSYDIIKAHGGELRVETVDGEFTEFIVSLPTT
jgi:two-component system NtrC family sensor kinase